MARIIRPTSLFGAAILLLGAGCTGVTGSGRIVTKEVHVPSFSRR